MCSQFGFNVLGIRIQLKSPEISWCNLNMWNEAWKWMLFMFFGSPSSMKALSFFLSMTHVNFYLLLSLYVFLLPIPLNCALQGQGVFFVCPKALAGTSHINHTNLLNGSTMRVGTWFFFILHYIVLVPRSLPEHVVFRFRD